MGNTSGTSHKKIADIIVPVFCMVAGGLIGVGGSMGSTYLANKASSEQAGRQMEVAWETQILNWRMNTIDQAISVFAKRPGIQDYWTQYLNAGSNPPVEVIDKLTEYRGEYERVIYSATMYFGPQTDAAVTALSNDPGPWWSKDKAKQDALLVTMMKEMSDGLKYFSAPPPTQQTEGP